MTGQPEINDIAKETISILEYFNPEFLDKIPKHFLKDLQELAKDSKIVVNIDKNKKLENQPISEDSKDLIGLIYYSYIASDDEKAEIERAWDENELKFQNELKKKYNVDNLFENRNKSNYNFDENKNNIELIEYKENIFQKVINKIKKLVNKK